VCPGAAPARAEARFALTAFFDHFVHGTVQLEPGFEFENVTTFFEIGPQQLPVVTTGP
jgi:cytochrome P450